MNNFRANWLPYALVKIDDEQGGWIPLNRHYKPLGMPSRTWVDYSSVPVECRIKNISSATAKRLSWKQEGHDVNESMIFLYNDRCIPTGSKKDWLAYSAKLDIISSLKTF
jgi:hypothetical protein